ncbi:MAG: circadian clock KaiB family protein [Hyphomonadaceae bacterium]
MTERVLRLFVSGNAASSQRAKETLQQLDKDGLIDGWRLEFVDVLAEPDAAEKAGILATPTLTCDVHARSRRIVGDFTDKARMLEFLSIELGKRP